MSWGGGGATLPPHWVCQKVVELHRRSEEHTSELQSQSNLVCRLLLEKKKRILHRSNHSIAASLMLSSTAVCFSDSHHPLSLHIDSPIRAPSRCSACVVHRSARCQSAR